jgi:hypothetical protein
MEAFLQTLRDAPAEAWVGLLGVLFGSLLTTFGVWLTNRASRSQLKLQLDHDERLQRQRLTKERLEELYILVCHWLNGMFKNYMHLTLVMKGQTDYNQYLDTLIAMEPQSDFSRLEMIIGIYGGSVQSKYQAAIDAREKTNSIVSSHKSSYRRGESGLPYLKPFTDAQLDLERVCEELKAEIANAARDA